MQGVQEYNEPFIGKFICWIFHDHRILCTASTIYYYYVYAILLLNYFNSVLFGGIQAFQVEESRIFFCYQSLDNALDKSQARSNFHRTILSYAEGYYYLR